MCDRHPKSRIFSWQPARFTRGSDLGTKPITDTLAQISYAKACNKQNIAMHDEYPNLQHDKVPPKGGAMWDIGCLGSPCMWGRALTVVTGVLSLQVAGGVVLREGAQELGTVRACRVHGSGQPQPPVGDSRSHLKATDKQQIASKGVPLLSVKKMARSV
jgi:hypothetical protein